MCGAPSVRSATGAAVSAPAPACTAVTAAASRPLSRPGATTMKAADSAAEASTSRSPSELAPPPPTPATRLTPAEREARSRPR